MIDKHELLSIGEMSKLTGAGIRALHYYERKNILKPAYIDPETNYRYYNLEQINFVEIITSCVKLNIPLKDLIGLFETDDFEHLWDFFVRNKKIAEEKLKTINTVLALSDKALLKMELYKAYELEQVYEREFSEKIYYTKPCGSSLQKESRIKLLLELEKEAIAELETEKADEPGVLMEHGFLCEYTPKGNQYYTFIEIPECLAQKNSIKIPSRTRFFRLDINSKIEDAPRIFEQHLKGKNNFMVVEVEDIMSGKSRIQEPIYELRLISWDDDEL